jgi:hypothetical protein
MPNKHGLEFLEGLIAVPSFVPRFSEHRYREFDEAGGLLKGEVIFIAVSELVDHVVDEDSGDVVVYGGN